MGVVLSLLLVTAVGCGLYYFVLLPEQKKVRQRQDAEWKRLVQEWRANSDDPNYQQRIKRFLAARIKHRQRSQEFTNSAYSISLQLVERGKPATTVFALEMGRLNNYDEQAIQNDIDVRTK